MRELYGDLYEEGKHKCSCIIRKWGFCKKMRALADASGRIPREWVLCDKGPTGDRHQAGDTPMASNDAEAEGPSKGACTTKKKNINTSRALTNQAKARSGGKRKRDDGGMGL